MNRSFLIVLFCAAGACGNDPGSEQTSGSAASASPASSKPGTSPTAGDKPARKAKVTHTAAQLKETYDSLKAESDFKKHREMIVTKLGQPAKEDGDSAFWYGIKPAAEGEKERCFEFSASPTKGNGSRNCDDINCWE